MNLAYQRWEKQRQLVMKMQMLSRFESGFENCPQAARGKVSEDPMTLLLAAQQHERIRIAQELHDTLLQGFTGIVLKLDTLSTSLPPALQKTKQQLRQALEQMDHYLGETRRSIWNLRSPTLQGT